MSCASQSTRLPNVLALTVCNFFCLFLLLLLLGRIPEIIPSTLTGVTTKPSNMWDSVLQNSTNIFPVKFGSFSFDREPNKNMKYDGITSTHKYITHLRRLIFIGASMRQKKEYFEAKKQLN